MSRRTLVDSGRRGLPVPQAKPYASFLTPAVLLLGAFATTNAAALGLGKMTVHSRLGAAFSAEVELLSVPNDHSYNSACFHLVPPVAAEAGLPVLTHATLSMQRENKKARLLIRSPQPVNEPVLQINLRAACGAEIARNYTLIIDPPEPGAALPEVPRVSAAAGTSASRAGRTGSPPANNDSDADQWQAAAGETALSIASSLFPRQSGAQRRFVRALQAENPGVDLGPRGDAPLAAGQSLKMPDRRQSVIAARESVAAAAQSSERKAAPAKKAKPRAVATPASVPEKASSGMSDRLRLSGVSPDEEREADEWSLRMSTELSYERINTVSESQRSILRLEYKLLAAIYDQASQQLSIAEQVRQLESTVAELKSATQASLGVPAGGESATASVAQPAAPMTPAVTVPKTATRQDDGLPSSWMWLGGLLALVAALVWIFHRSTFRVTRNSLPLAGEGEKVSGAEALAAASLSPATLQVMRNAGDQAGPAHRSDDTLVLDQRHNANERRPLAPAAPDSMNGTTAVIEHYEFDPVMELAEIMLAFGRVKGAVEALQEYISANPDGAIQPWMKLIEVYRQNDMRAEYEKLALQFAANFNVQPAAWDELPEAVPAPVLAADEERAPIDELLARTPSISAIPEIREAIVRQWATPEGMRETLVDLNTLLRDRTNAVQQGLSLSMVNEILFLQAVLGKRLEKTG